MIVIKHQVCKVLCKHLHDFRRQFHVIHLEEYAKKHVNRSETRRCMQAEFPFIVE
jgi:hypothetical protein